MWRLPPQQHFQSQESHARLLGVGAWYEMDGHAHLSPNCVCGATYAPVRTASRISPIAYRNRGALRSTNRS